MLPLLIHLPLFCVESTIPITSIDRQSAQHPPQSASERLPLMMTSIISSTPTVGAGLVSLSTSLSLSVFSNLEGRLGGA